ncbi:MAG: hypothetical protein P4L50_25345 [Anaerolineaceae bacterium]|nr:hypothetical protein [Anaerolineaceae bacterium]
MFSTPPPVWETHASFIIAVIALLVAIITLPTVIQMFFGKPKIDIIPHLHIGDNGYRTLRCYIANAPIKSKILRWMGIVRSDAEVGCDFAIFEMGTNRKIVEFVRPVLYGESHESRHLRIVAGMVPARIIIVHHNDLGAKIWNDDQIDKVNNDDTGVPLSKGYYMANISAIISNYGVISKQLEFTIGETPSKTYW